MKCFVLRCRATCKWWKGLLERPEFVFFVVVSPPPPLSLKLKSTLHLCSLLPSLSPCEILSSFTSLLVCHFSSYWSMHTWVKWYKLLKAGERETNLIHDRSIINFVRTCKGLSLTGVKQMGIGLEVYFSVSLWQSFLHFDKANGDFHRLIRQHLGELKLTTDDGLQMMDLFLRQGINPALIYKTYSLLNRWVSKRHLTGFFG